MRRLTWHPYEPLGAARGLDVGQMKSLPHWAPRVTGDKGCGNLREDSLPATGGPVDVPEAVAREFGGDHGAMERALGIAAYVESEMPELNEVLSALPVSVQWGLVCACSNGVPSHRRLDSMWRTVRDLPFVPMEDMTEAAGPPR